MLLALLGGAILAPEFVADRFSLGARLRRLEKAWMVASAEKKVAAVPDVTSAVTGFFGGQFGRACQSLDRAMTLLGEPTVPFDLQLVPAYGSEKEATSLVVSWAYTPEDGKPVTLSIAGQDHVVDPGELVSLPVAAKIQDGVATVSIKSGKWVSDVRAGRSQALGEELRSGTGRLADFLRASNAPGARPEADLLATPGALEQMLRKDRKDGEFYVREGSTDLRGWLPREASGTLLVALHGAGGSEHMMFEAYGDGAVIKEAQKRGWAVASPRTSRVAVMDCVAWYRSIVGEDPKRLFVLGHSAGGATALGSGTVMPKPAGLALFAPAAGAIPAALAGTPILVLVGKYELGGLRQMGQRLGKSPGVEFKEVPTSEHLMVVADAYADAFQFFDRLAKN